MAKVKKKPKVIKEETPEELEENKKEEGQDDEELEHVFDEVDEEGVKVEEEEEPTSSYQVLGQLSFVDNRPILVTSSWMSAATEFPASVQETTALDQVPHFPKKLAKRVKQLVPSWFPVQKAVLPTLMTAIARPPVARVRDLAVTAPTGSGKTLCYVLPILAAIGKREGSDVRHRPVALVMAPVQTLVKQIVEEFEKFNVFGARIIALSGASAFDTQRRTLLKNGADVVVATPGRLMDHIWYKDDCSDEDQGFQPDISAIRYLVVDEADGMSATMRLEWLNTVEKLSGASQEYETGWWSEKRAPQKLLFSATLSRDVDVLHEWRLHRPRLFRATVKYAAEQKLKENGERIVDLEADHVTGALALPTSIKQTIITVPIKWKPLAVQLILEQNTAWKKVLVFTAHRESSARLSKVLMSLGSAGREKKDNARIVEQLTADLFGNRRQKVLKRFASGQTRVLVASDVLARGVDVPDIDCVVNYDVPREDRLFVHRAGRTGRAGRVGHVLSLVDVGREAKFFKKMLVRNGLMAEGVEEKTMRDEDFEQRVEQYKKVLEELGKETAGTGGVVKKGRKRKRK